MRVWPLKVEIHTQAEIAYAVSDRRWQVFRLSLKGLPTEEKLRQLFAYRAMAEFDSTEEASQKFVRVDNYINALKRGGQLNEHNQVVR